MTAEQALLLPTFLHVLMTMALAIAVGLARRRALVNRETRLRDVVLDNRAWPDSVRKLANNLDNQFQMPMLWYAATAFTLVLGLADTAAIILSWAFLALRLAHSVIHIGHNILIRRFAVFATGALVLSLYWLWLAFKVFA
jgi:hypothetical protein